MPWLRAAPVWDAASPDYTVTGSAWGPNFGYFHFNCEECTGAQEEKVCNEDQSRNLVGYYTDINSITDSISKFAYATTSIQDASFWLNFDRSCVDEPYPAYPDSRPLAYATSSNPQYPLGSPLSLGTELRGWARAMSAIMNPLPDQPPPAWDGWVGLNCKDWEEKLGGSKTCLDGNDPAFNPINNIVDFKVTWAPSTRKLAGWAWGGELVGWISFNCRDYEELTNICFNSSYAGYDPNRAVCSDEDFLESTGGTTKRCVGTVTNPDTQMKDYAVVADINLPPTVRRMSTSKDYTGTFGDCSITPVHTLAWQYYDPSWEYPEYDATNTPQYAYEIEVSTRRDFSSIDASSTIVSAGNSAPFTVAISPSPAVNNDLAYNQRYYWRIKVYDTYYETIGDIPDSPLGPGKPSLWMYPSSIDPSGATTTRPDIGPTDSAYYFDTAKHLYPVAAFRSPAADNPSSASIGDEISFWLDENQSRNVDNALGCFTNNEAQAGRFGGDPTTRIECPNVNLAQAQLRPNEVRCPAGNADQCYAWDFDYVNRIFTVDATGNRVRYKFTNQTRRNYTIAFRVTDADNYTCVTRGDGSGGEDATQRIQLQLPLPKFRETAPSGLERLRDYTASLVDIQALDFTKIIFK